MILRVFAVLLIIPLGLIGILAAAFIVAPRSRFGVWLDHFVPRLLEPRIAGHGNGSVADRIPGDGSGVA